MSELLLTGISQLVTPQGPGAKHGAAMRELRILRDAAIAIDDGVISWVGAASEWSGHAESTINLEIARLFPA